MDMETGASKISGRTETVEIEDRRDDLLDMVRKGVLSPTDAEKIAAQENLGSFTSVPSAEDFPVDEEAYWSIEQAVAWLIWRTTEAVRRFHNPFRLETIVWRDLFLPSGTGELEPRGFELAPRGEASLDEVKIFAASGIDSPGCSFDKAMEQLLGYLKSGRVVAAAVHVADARGVEIQPHEWQNLEMLDTESGPVSLGMPSVDGGILGVATYRRVFVPRPALLEVVAAQVAKDAPASPERAVEHDTMLPPNLADKIRAAGGIGKLTQGEEQIWNAIKAIGDDLPARRQDYIRVIKERVVGTEPSTSTIDRFFAKFRDAGDIR